MNFPFNRVSCQNCINNKLGILKCKEIINNNFVNNQI